MENQHDTDSTFAKNLKYYLEKNRMTQKKLAELLNVSSTTVYFWCRGSKIPRIDKIDAMCKIFSTTRTDLMTDSDVYEKDMLDKLRMLNIDGKEYIKKQLLYATNDVEFLIQK